MQGAKAASGPEDCQPPQLQIASKLAAGGNSYVHHSRYVAGCLPCKLQGKGYILSEPHYICLLQLAELLQLQCGKWLQVLDEQSAMTYIASSVSCVYRVTCGLQGVCNIKQRRSRQLIQVTDSLGHQILACSAQHCNNSGTPRGTCTWVQSQSSHTVTSRLCGNAASAQLGSHTSGQHVYKTEREKALSAHIALIGWSACTTPLPPQHLTQLSTGTTARMRRCQSRCWLAVTSGLSGSAQLAIVNGKPPFSCAHVQRLDVDNVRHTNEVGSHGPHLLKLSLPAWLSGTTSAMMPKTPIQTTSLLAVASRCTGCAHAVHMGSPTTGQQRQTCA